MIEKIVGTWGKELKKLLFVLFLSMLCRSIFGQDISKSIDSGEIYYLIQISAYANKNDAINKSKEIDGSYVDNVMRDGQTIYRVRFGKFISLDETKVERDRIKSMGENPIIVQVDANEASKIKQAEIEKSLKTPKFNKGTYYGTFAKISGAQSVFDYRFTCNYNCAAYISPQDPDFVYIFDNANNGESKVDRILSKSDLDQQKANIEKREINDKNKYEKNLVNSKESLKSRIDVVAQVLNYSSGCKDDGCDTYSWAVKDAKQCVYERVNFNAGNDTGYAQIQQLMQVAQAISSPSFGVTGSSGNLIKLNELDPKSLKIATMDHVTTEQKEIHDPHKYSRIVGYNNVQHEFQTQEVQYMGKPIFSQQNLDVSRLKRGWALIYSKYCTGTKKAF